MRRIDISDPDKPAMEIVDGVSRPSGPVDLKALATIERVCPGCLRVTASASHHVRIVSTGDWLGTKVFYVETGAELPCCYSAVVDETERGLATAKVLMYHTIGDQVALCPACIYSAARVRRRHGQRCAPSYNDIGPGSATD